MKTNRQFDGGTSRRIAAGLVRIYQMCSRAVKPACCRFSPSCSEYARQAFLRHGIWRGAWLAVRRILRCHPFYRGAIHDPVPPLPANRRG